jgi:predicted Zn-dependent protease
MESEAELAAVLAHEVGHVDQRHVIEEIRRGAVIQQARDESQLQGALLDQIADAGTTLLFTGLSREDEMEADSLGILYASATGYRAAGLLDFLNHLRAQEQAGAGGMREWVATHPSTEDRIAAVQRQLAGTAQGGADGAARFRERTGASGVR